MVMNLDIGCSFVFDATVDTHAVMMFEPHVTELSRVADSRLEVVGDMGALPPASYVDSFGNRCTRITLNAGQTSIRFLARAHVAAEGDRTDRDAAMVPPMGLPDEVLQFLMPSRYCESDQVADLAWSTFGTLGTGWDRVQRVCNWVHDRTVFRYGSSSPGYSAVNVLENGVGVCRDFTHLSIAMCRALNIPTRYVCGYLPDIGVEDPGTPMDFCAWMEVFLDGQWFTFDPRNNEHRIGRVVVGRGRDAADVAMVTSFGRVELVGMTVWAEPGSGESWNDSSRPGRTGSGLVELSN